MSALLVLGGVVVGWLLQEISSRRQRRWQTEDRAAEREEEHRRWRREQLLAACTEYIAATQEWDLRLIELMADRQDGKTFDPDAVWAMYHRPTLALTQVRLVAGSGLRQAAFAYWRAQSLLTGAALAVDFDQEAWNSANRESAIRAKALHDVAAQALDRGGN